MFEMDGLELTNLIKKEYDTDVVVMTGYTSEHSYEQAISKGASDFLFKPVRFEELSLRLKRVLKERQLSSERSEMLPARRRSPSHGTDDHQGILHASIALPMRRRSPQFARWKFCMDAILF